MSATTMIFDTLLTVLISLLLINAIAARSTSDVYDELVEVLKDIKELETDSRIDGEKRGTITTRDDSVIEKQVRIALDDAKNALEIYNEIKRFYYYRGGNLQAFSTPIQRTRSTTDYTYTLLSSPGCATGDVKSVVFEVRACNDAHVGLKVDDSKTGDLYEIVIGGWGNTQSVIRTAKQGTNMVIVNKKNLLDCNEYRTFMVNWAGGHIQVYIATGSGWDEFMDWQDTAKTTKDVNFIGLTTARWASGFFRTPIRGDDFLFETPKQFNDVVYTMLQDHRFPVAQLSTYIVFEVMACNDAHIGLFQSYDQDIDEIIEVVIGTGINTQSVIRSGSTNHVTEDRAAVVDCDEYRAFLVSWEGGNIQVLRQTATGWEQLMSWTDQKKRSFNYVGFTTSLFASGSWRFSRTYETGLDRPAGDTSSDTMAGLNNMDTDKTEIEGEEAEAVKSLVATKLLLDRKVFKNLKELRTNDIVLKLWAGVSGKKCDGGSLTSVNCSGLAQYVRAINGECNNLNHPHWGAAGSSQIRVLSPGYDDGVNSPRTLSVDGTVLPSGRHLSRSVLYDPTNIPTPNDPHRSAMMTVWGQFIDHDIGETPVSKGYNSVTVQCCGILDVFIRGKRDQCFPIVIDPATDPSYTHDCMNFVRSTAARTDPCKPGIRQQINAITSYLDGSMIYGSEHDVAESLRADDGKMKVEGNNMLPKNDDSACVRDHPDAYCFLAGDVRVNENPHLATMHTAFVRYHNLLAQRFANLGFQNSDEIYERTRRIIGAIIQHITYSKWLPSAIGSTAMNDFGLDLDLDYKYDDTVNGGVLLHFTTAEMRYGHTLIQTHIDHLADDGTVTRSNNLEDVFFVTDPVIDDIQGIARWTFKSPCKEGDGLFVDAIDNKLFKNKNGLGFDLSALNIQRGRDHGLRGYVEYLNLCSQKKPTQFDELLNHNISFQKNLSNVYSDVRDIDLFVGGITEIPVSDGEVGPTFACLLATQFEALKKGDRFWYQNTEQFTDEQIKNVEEVELSKIFCEVFDFDEIQPDLFIISDLRTKCKELDDINVKLWAEKNLSEADVKLGA